MCNAGRVKREVEGELAFYSDFDFEVWKVGTTDLDSLLSEAFPEQGERMDDGYHYSTDLHGDVKVTVEEGKVTIERKG
jgi:hypothetical protein